LPGGLKKRDINIPGKTDVGKRKNEEATENTHRVRNNTERSCQEEYNALRENKKNKSS